MKKLVLVTSQYPYGNGETFIENEIQYLSKSFDEVYIYATEINESKSLHIRYVPDNVKPYFSNAKSVCRKSYIRSVFNKRVISEIFKNCIGKNMISKISSVCYFERSVSEESKGIATILEKGCFSSDDQVVIYSYWLSTVGMVAIKIRDELRKKGINVKLYSRTHGFDLYEERAYLKYQPFQKYLVERIDRVFPCSEQGSEYLKKHYPNFASKIQCAYLGVQDKFNNGFPNNSNIHIVSCSNLIPLKRVHLILQALELITDIPVKWTHFGDGELLEGIKAKATSLPKNITAEFPGRIPNSDIYDYYNHNNVNLFINVSESEGLPVSIMEAISFGIPVIATNVGGTSEIVQNNINGLLLLEHFEVLDLAKAIRKIALLNYEEYQTVSHNSRRIYEEKFSAEKNYAAFCKELLR